MRQCVEKGLVSGKLMATDPHSCESERVPHFRASGRGAGGAWGLLERLDTYEEEGLAELERRTGKRRKKRVKQVKRDKRRSHERVSRTDPEAGRMKRPGKPRGRYHLSHQTTDTDCGIITGVTVTPGDVSGSAYDLPLACRVLEEHGKERRGE